MKPWLTQMPEGMLLKSEDLHQIYMPLTAVTHWANIARKMDTPMSISGCSLFDGVTFDPFSFQEEGLTYAEVDVGRREVS